MQIKVKWNEDSALCTSTETKAASEKQLRSIFLTLKKSQTDWKLKALMGTPALQSTNEENTLKTVSRNHLCM